MESTNPTLDRLDQQISWYGGRSGYNQRMFKSLKAATFILALAIPLCAAFGSKVIVTGVLGAVIVMIESFQQLNQYHHNWITYRSTSESLKHEKYLFLARAGHYSSSANPEILLAERVEALVSQEHAKWASVHERLDKSLKTPATRV